MHSRVSVNGIALAAEPVGDQLAWAAEEGIAHLGLPVEVVLRDGVETTAAAAVASGVRIAYLVFPSMFALDRAAGWEADGGRIRAALDAAAAVAAPMVYTTTGPAGKLTFEAAREALEAAVIPVLRHADELGVDLLVETTSQLRNDLGFLHDLRDTVDVAATAGLGVCADLLWCWRERDLEGTLRRSRDRIGLVQVSDCELAPATMPCRLVPGDGVVELERPLGWLAEAGYDGLFDVELLGPAIEAEGPHEALARGARWLSERLDRLGA